MQINALFKGLMVTAFAMILVSQLCAQDLGFERDRQAHILDVIRDDVKKNYYDPAFHGVDVEAKYQAAKARIQSAKSVGEMSAIIAAFLIEFDDSHLFFLPPGRAGSVSYGFSFYMVGDKCYVNRVDKESEAFKIGLRPGDQLLAIEGFEPTRRDLWKMQYAYYSLRPRTGLSLKVQKTDGTEVKYDVPSKIKHGKQVIDLTGQSDAGFDMWEYDRKAEDAYRRATRQYIYDKLPGVFIWRIPGFEIEPGEVDTIIDRARKFPAIIIDLRGNSGGRVDMLRRLIGNLFPDDVKVGDEKKRKETKEIIAKSRGDKSYEGKIIVLIDSRSASASEVFSRVIQLEKRGTIIGDRSAGAVMESMVIPHEVGMDTVVTFETSMTIADLLMKDGKSLEKIGVTPDILLLPSGAEMAAGQDPVLAKAVELSGEKMTADEAGKFFYQVESQDR